MMATIRLEQRYLIPTDRCEAIAGLLLWETVLRYGCSNLYFDDDSGQFSRTSPGSPRLRLRMYRTGELCFGNLELKRVTASGDTEKHRWPLETLSRTYQDRLPELRGGLLNLPETGSPFAFLMPPESNGLPFPAASRCIGRLSYQRVSYQLGGSRVSIDSSFHPQIQPTGYSLLECKTAGREILCDKIAAIPGVLPSRESKFVMFAKVGGCR